MERKKTRLLRLHSDDLTTLTGGADDAVVVHAERDRLRREVWKLAKGFTHVALTDLLRDVLYELACGYHYHRQEDRDLELAERRLAELRERWGGGRGQKTRGRRNNKSINKT